MSTATKPATFSDEIGFDDPSVTVNQFEKYKGTKGVTDRIAVIFPKRVKRAQVHYQEGLGYVHSTDYSVERFGAPQARFGTVIVQYKTDKFGKLILPFTEQSISVKFLIFGAKKFDLLRKANDEFPLDKHDLQVTCQEEKFQQLSFQSCKEAAWSAKPEIKKYVEALAEKMMTYMDSQLGQNLTKEQIQEKLGEPADTGSIGVVETSTANPDDMLNQLSP